MVRISPLPLTRSTFVPTLPSITTSVANMCKCYSGYSGNNCEIEEVVEKKEVQLFVKSSLSPLFMLHSEDDGPVNLSQLNSSIHTNYPSADGWYEITLKASNVDFALVNNEEKETYTQYLKEKMSSDERGLPSPTNLPLPPTSLKISSPGSYSILNNQVTTISNVGCKIGWGSCTSSKCEDNLFIDTLNCGSCGSPCMMGDNASSVACMKGTCVLTCIPGFVVNSNMECIKVDQVDWTSIP
jgi:hypothetical protein